MLLLGRDVVREMCQVDAANAYTLRVVTRCILFTIQLNQIKFAHPIRLFLRFWVGCQALKNNCTHDVAHRSLRACVCVYSTEACRHLLKECAEYSDTKNEYEVQ